MHFNIMCGSSLLSKAPLALSYNDAFLNQIPIFYYFNEK